MDNKSSITALMSAFGRAYHNENAPAPIFSDTMARGLMSDEEYRMIAACILDGMDFFAPGMKGYFANNKDALRYLVNTQIAPTPLARARFCEDSLKTAIRTGTKQYVILGAGLDTFAFRERQFMAEHRVYEVDYPTTQADKKLRISRAGWSVPDNLRFVPMDFTKDDLESELLKAGFDTTQKTFFSWLGVSMYLYRNDIEKLLRSISSFAAEGSSLLFDYADAGLFLSDVKRVQNMVAMAKVGGEEMKSGFEQLSMELMLSDHDFLVYEHLCSDEIQKLYFNGRTDNLSAFEHINYVHAVLKKSVC